MSTIYLRVYGGLGNQQFQYAFGKIKSLQYNKTLILDDSFYLDRYYPLKAIGYFFPFRLKKYNLNEKYTNQLQRELIGLITRYNKVQAMYKMIQNLPVLKKLLPVLISDNDFNESILQSERNIILCGYFQKYSINTKYKELIRGKLTYSEKLSNENNNYLKIIKSNVTVSIHVRRGDYIEKKNVASNYAKITHAYFKNAVEYISNIKKIDKLIIFSNDIQWAKDNLAFPYECIFIKNDGPDYEHQYLMSQCTHNIIPNSTYSWWAAYLNENDEKIVCVPSRWFASIDRINDIYIPEDWVKINA